MAENVLTILTKQLTNIGDVMSNQNAPQTPKNDDTDLPVFFDTLAGGVQKQIIQKVLSSVSKGVLQHGSKGKAGEVTLNFKITRLSDDSVEQGALKIVSTLSFAAPTQRGKKAENEARESVMYMTSSGLSDAPPRRLDEEAGHQQGMPTTAKVNNFAS